MNVLYEFRCGATYLAEVGCGEQNAPAGTRSSTGAARATCCCVVQRCPPPAPTGVAADHALARCSAFVEAHREGLRVVRAMYGCCGDGDDDSSRETVCQTSSARCDAATPLPDLDTLCPHTAALTPTALLSAVFALPPLTRVELARTPSPTRDGTDAAAAKERVPYLFYCYAPYATRSMTRDGLFTSSVEGQGEWRWLQSRFSTWYGFTSTLSCVLYDCAPAERARFTLAQYVTRAATTHAGGAPDGLAESSVLAWGEEMLWRLLNALLSSLALLHSAGLTLHGQLQAGDVVCFAVPACTSARLQDAATAVWSARGARVAGGRGARGAGSESARERVGRYMAGAARDVVLRDAPIGSRTPCHRAFFVLAQLPALLMENAGVASAEDGGATSEAGAGDFAAGTRADIAAVGRLVRAVTAEQRRLADGVGRAAPAAPSSELDVVIEHLTAAAAAVVETEGRSAQPALSAVQLVRLQALRLRVSRWTYQSIAEDRQMLARFCVGEEAGRCKGRHAAAAPGGADDEVRTLHARAALLAEREAKLDAFLQLYELTHEQLDSLPRLGPAAPGDACAAAALLQTRLQQGVRDATAMAMPTPRQSPAAAGAVRRPSPLLSPARDEAEAARVAASLHALATSVARDEASGLRGQTSTRRGSAQEVEVELSVEEQAAAEARARPTTVSACAASPSPSLAAVTRGGRAGRAAHPTLRLCPYDAATPFHHHQHPRSPRARTDDGWFARQLGVLEELRTSFAQSAAAPQRGGLSGRSSGSASRARVPTALGHTPDKASPRHETRVAVSAAASLRGFRDVAEAKAVGGDGGAGRGRSASDAAAPEMMRAGVWDARPARPSGATAHGGGTPTSSASLGRTPRHDPRDSPAVTSATGRSPDAHRRDAEDEAARELLTRLRGGVALTAWPR